MGLGGAGGGGGEGRGGVGVGGVGRGGEPDVDKAVLLVLDDFRSGRLGQATLEEPMR